MSVVKFACDKCNTVDIDVIGDSNNICTKCRTGKWHDHFEPTKYDPKIHVVVNRSLTNESDTPSFG